MLPRAPAFLLSALFIVACGGAPAGPAAPPAAPEPPAPAAPEEAPPAEAPPAKEQAAADEAPQDCCCEYNVPAGAGLLQFDRNQGTCKDGYYFIGCTDSGMCDLSDLPTAPLDGLGKVTIVPAEGQTASVTASAKQIYAHSQTIVFVPQPRDAVMDQWKADLEGGGWKVEVTMEPPDETHGPVFRVSKGDTAWFIDFLKDCQGSTGTCAFLEAGVKAS